MEPDERSKAGILECNIPQEVSGVTNADLKAAINARHDILLLVYLSCEGNESNIEITDET